jgi:hypothetical protein
MEIQLEKIWLFETQVSDPFYIGTKDGVSAKMIDPRTIELLDIETVYFFIDVIGKGGLTYNLKYGGEDSEIMQTYGKSHSDYTIMFNVPTQSQRILEDLIGKQFSLVGMRRDLSRFAIFGQFECEELAIDNEVQQRVRFVAKNTNARIYNIQSLNITQIINTITEDDIADLIGGFDYTLDFKIN